MKPRPRKKDRKAQRTLAALAAVAPHDDDISTQVVNASRGISVTVTDVASGITASATAATEAAARAQAFESLYAKLRRATRAPKS